MYPVRGSLGRLVSALAALAVPFALIAGCGDSAEPTDEHPRGDRTASTPADPGRPVRVTNGEIIIPTEPKQIAVLWRPTLSALVHLDRQPLASVGDAAVLGGGLEPYLPDEFDADSIEVISSSPSPSDIDVDALRELGPDLIIGTNAEDLVEIDVLAELSSVAPTILLEWDDTTTWGDHVREVAEVLEVPEQATAVLAEYDARLAEVRTAVGDSEHTTVSIITAYDASEIRVEPPASFAGRIMTGLGFRRPADQRAATAAEPTVIAPDDLDRADADVLIVLANTENGQTIDDNLVVSSPAWRGLSAVAANRAYVFDYAYWGADNYDAAMRVLTDIESSLGTS